MCSLWSAYMRFKGSRLRDTFSKHKLVGLDSFSSSAVVRYHELITTQDVINPLFERFQVSVHRLVQALCELQLTRLLDQCPVMAYATKLGPDNLFGWLWTALLVVPEAVDVPHRHDVCNLDPHLAVHVHRRHIPHHLRVDLAAVVEQQAVPCVANAAKIEVAVDLPISTRYMVNTLAAFILGLSRLEFK